MTRFHPHPHVIDLLVGEELYTSADAALRELLQNAEDACSLQGLTDPAFQARIIVRYSPEHSWVEVEDNGLGMNESALENSFSAIGAPKEEVEHLREILARSPQSSGQIARFGIGILSCFGVAKAIKLRTKMDGDSGIALSVPDYREDFVVLSEPPLQRGTTVRLILKPGGPMQANQVPTAVRKYARHAPHVEVQNADTGACEETEETWLGDDQPGALILEDEALSYGVLSLHPQWGESDAPIEPQLRVCNGGFLVSDNIPDLLPAEITGYVGELDVLPGKLRILMNREGFKRDGEWQQFSSRLISSFAELIRKMLDVWEGEIQTGLEALRDTVAHRAIVLAQGPPRTHLPSDVVDRLEKLLSDAVMVSVADADRKTTISSAIQLAAPYGKVFYVREEQANRMLQERFDNDNTSVQLSERIETRLRVSHLTAKGATVVRCRQRRYTERFGQQNQVVQVHEADLLLRAAQRLNLPCVAVEEATLKEVELDLSPQSRLISGVLELDGDLKLANLPDSNSQVVRDFSGRLLNCAHPEVRAVLEALPSAIGNPIRKALLQIYMDIANYQLSSARGRVLELLTLPNLEEVARLKGGSLQREYLRERIADLIGGDQ